MLESGATDPVGVFSVGAAKSLVVWAVATALNSATNNMQRISCEVGFILTCLRVFTFRKAIDSSSSLKEREEKVIDKLKPLLQESI